MPPIIRIGMKTAISDTLMEITVKPISGTLERRLQRRDASLQMAGDVFDDDDRIVNHKTGGDGQRHQRQIVDAVAEQVHSAEGADQ